MRLSVGAVLCLFLLILGAGCRKTLAPVTDNQAPETWIVAAPQDTITTFDPITGTPIPPPIGAIPVRFHLYWAGADHDGAVNGFFYAIVETLATVPDGSISVPPLPGPKARDYRFTNKTDSIFVFTTSEELNTRQHAFFIYAVDDKGKPDPTPARFIFRAYDSYPPEAIIEELRAEGTEYELLDGGGVREVDVTRYVTDFFEISNDHPAPRDTVTANARLYIRWTGRPTIPSTIIKHYRYKLDEPDFQLASPTDTTVEYNTNPANKISPGRKVFTLYAVGQSGWRGTMTRWFEMNFSPDTWFAGPDPNDPAGGWQTHVDGNGKRYWYVNLEATGWQTFAGIPNSQLSSDSLQFIPPLRTERRTFFEMYNDILWVHQEGDTVHMNSWVMFPAGGYDRDSPYAVKVNTALLKPEYVSPVLTPGPANGAPIGFRVRIPIRNSIGGVTQPSETTTYPVYDPTSVYDRPVINGYQGMTTSGRAFTEIFAEDGNGAVDRRVGQRPGGSIGIVNRTQDVFTTVDDCIASGKPREDCELRGKIITFYVNKRPRLRREDPLFEPDANDLISRNATTGQVTQTFNMPGEDKDQLDPDAALNRVGGTPPYPPILERKIAILGRHPGTGRDTCYFVPQEFIQANGITITIPVEMIAPGNITMRIRLCDCSDCDVTAWTGKCAPPLPYPLRESSPNDGMCVDTDIPIRLQAPTPEATVGDSQATQRPGSPSDTGRRQ